MNNQRRHLYKDLKDKELRQKGIFIGESAFVVERLIRSGWDVDSIVCTPAQGEYFEALAGGKCPVEVLSREEISSLVGYQFHRGVLAAGMRPAWPDLNTLLARQSPESLLLVCPAISDPSNVGALIRSARAFGVGGIVLGKDCGDPLARIAIRASMGNVFYIPLTFMENEAEAAALLKEHGFTISGTVLDEGAQKLNLLKRTPREALVMGHESEGLSSLWLKSSNRLITIPMSDTTDSLNVAASAAIFLYHLSQAQ